MVNPLAIVYLRKLFLIQSKGLRIDQDILQKLGVTSSKDLIADCKLKIFTTDILV